jgi:hypothetical protein
MTESRTISAGDNCRNVAYPARVSSVVTRPTRKRDEHAARLHELASALDASLKDGERQQLVLQHLNREADAIRHLLNKLPPLDNPANRPSGKRKKK